MSSLQIRLLGKVEVERGGERLTLPGRKTQALLVYLIAQNGPHSRRKLYDLFCANAEDPAAALRWHLSRLRHALGPDLLLAEEDRLRFNPLTGEVDCVEFERVFDTHLIGQKTEALAAALDLYRDELAAGLNYADSTEFELWLLTERTRLHACYERGLQELIARYIAVGSYEPAIQRSRQLVRANPLLEQAHAHLIWLYARTGQLQAALQQFETCREILKRELAVEPTPGLGALYEDVRTGKLNPTFPVAGLPAPQTPDLRQTIHLAGRAAELERLDRAWQESRQGRGEVVLVQAEAGGGKTYLIHEFARHAPEAHFMLGPCYESTRPLPYRPWIELLEARLSELSDAAIRELSPFCLQQLHRLVPSLAGRLKLRTAAPPPPGSDDTERLFAAIHEFLFRPGEARPGLIFIDDLQWADRASLQLFHFLARRVREACVLLIGAYRSEEVDPASALQTVLADLGRLYPQELALPPLTQAAISDLIGRHWSNLPFADAGSVSQILARATGGNPLFITEVLRELSHMRTLPEVLPVPRTVQDLIGRRLRLLPERTRQVIEAIAVFNAPITVSQAQRVSARAEEEITEAVDLSLRARLLLLQPNAQPLRYEFSHDLVRVAVLNQMTAVRRRSLHRRVAAMLVQTSGSMDRTGRGELASRIMQHALAGEDYGTVLHWASLAGAHAEQLCAYTDALSAFTAASSALVQLRSEGTLEPGKATLLELELLLERIRVLYRLGRRADEAVLLEQTAAILEHHHNAFLEAMFHLRQAAYSNSISQFPAGLEAAQRAYESFRQLGDEQYAAEALEMASGARQSMGNVSEARQLMEQANALYRAAGDFRSENRTRVDLAWCLIELCEVEEALKHLTQALAFAEQQKDKLGSAYACFVMATGWNLYCHAAGIRECAQEAERLYQELGMEAWEARACMYLAAGYLYENDLVTARSLGEQAFAQAQLTGDHWVEGWSAHMLARLALQEWDIQRAEHWLKHAFELRRAHGEMQNQIIDLAWMGRLCLVQGQKEQALANTTEAVQRLNAIQSETQIWQAYDILMCHAEALAASGNSAEATTYLQCAYDSLMQFAAKINDPHIKQNFLEFVLNARILAAHSSGEIKTFPA
jgi:predicted ATPase/DNA-binding SARP family transcriptional activator